MTKVMESAFFGQIQSFDLPRMLLSLYSTQFLSLLTDFALSFFLSSKEHPDGGCVRIIVLTTFHAPIEDEQKHE
jgi:hypothetical protein